jgi:diacylglycerol kinase family enzyme
VNGKTFLNNAVVGLYPVFRAVRADLEQRGWPSRLAWLWGWVTTIRKMPFFRFRLIMNGREVERRTPYMLIGNNEHAMQGWQLGTRHTMNSGELWIYVLRPQSRLALLGMALKVLLGVFRRQEHFDVYHAQEVYVDIRNQRLAVSLDGEIHVMQAPLHFRSLPSVLRVIVPEDGR